MSTDSTFRPYQSPGVPGGVRFRPRDEPPEPLFGPPNVNYPARDGRGRWDDTLQATWILRIRGGLQVRLRNETEAFVSSNLLWYPVEGNNRLRLAPDAMVVFGRPKCNRNSYVQHEEGGVSPQVVFEILSPGNRKRVMDFKRRFYEKFGVKEYYVFDPYKIELEVWVREGNALTLNPRASGWVSPLLGLRFELADDMTIFHPDGQPFLDYVDLVRQRDESERRAEEARIRAEEARNRAEAARIRADEVRDRAEAARRRNETQSRIERMAARLRELGIDPDA